ncbi:zeta toxin family protein [Trinickia sp. LjRoot230]|uniref:zeta toxin family protein n=1 Tax=Trinickia sp. LjRoot230 TaxID=3342288 RepID=UPI003ED12483
MKWSTATDYRSSSAAAFSPSLPCVVEIDSDDGDTTRFFDIPLDRALRILNDPLCADEPLLNENEAAFAQMLVLKLEQTKANAFTPRVVTSRPRRTSLRGEVAARELGQREPDPDVSTHANRVVEQTTLSFNDFHGRLRPGPGLSITCRDVTAEKTLATPSGGVEYLTSMVRQAKRKYRNLVVAGVGDQTGSSQSESAELDEEPTIYALNAVPVDIAVPGNHEWDKGTDAFLRIQHGGPRPSDSLPGRKDFVGAQFPYVAANVHEIASGKPLLQPYAIFEFEGVKIAYVGAVTKTLPLLVTPDHLAGLEVLDEAQAIGQYLPELEASGVRTVIVLLHEGAHPRDVDEMQASGKLTGRLGEIHDKLAPSIRDVLCGHTHLVHMLLADGRLFTQAGAYGQYVIQLTRILDQQSGETAFRFARAIAIDRSRFDPDPRQRAIISESQTLLSSVLSRPIVDVHLRFPIRWQNKADIEAAIMEGRPVSGETLIGNVFADALCQATDADMAFINLGAMRAGLPAGALTYGDLVDMLPNRGRVVSMDLTGEQVFRLLEDQWLEHAVPKILQISDELSYRWDPSLPRRVVRSSVKLHGHTLDPDATYRVTTSEHLAKGGAGHRVFLEGTRRVTGMLDIEALERHLPTLSNRHRPSLGRIARIDSAEPWTQESLEFQQAAHKLDPAEHDLVFRSTMSLLLDSTVPAALPLAIVLGGQPGSGKSTLARKLAPRFPAEERFVKIDPDPIRALHPDYRHLLYHYNEHAADIVHPDSAQWADELVEASLQARRNLLIDRAAWDVHKLSELVRQLHEAGYRVEFHVASVPIEMSKARSKRRFEEQNTRHGFGRLISDRYHEQASEGLATSVAEMERHMHVDAIHIYDFDQAEVYSNAVVEGKWQQDPRATEVFSRYRQGD